MEDIFTQTQRIRDASEASLKDMCVPPMTLITDFEKAFERVFVQGALSQPPPLSVPSTDEYDSLELLRQRAEDEVQSLQRENMSSDNEVGTQSLSKLQEELLEQGNAAEQVKALKRVWTQEKTKYDSRKDAVKTAEAKYKKYRELNVAKQLKGGSASGNAPQQHHEDFQLTEPLFFLLSELEIWKDGNDDISPFSIDVVKGGDEEMLNSDSKVVEIHPWRVIVKFAKISICFTHIVNLGIVSVKAWNEEEGGVKRKDCQEILEGAFPEAGDGRNLPTLESVYYLYKALGRHCERIEKEWYPEEAVGKPYAWVQMLAGIQVNNIQEPKYISVLELLEGINKL